MRFPLVLAALLLAVLAYGMAAGVGTGAPQGVSAADCFHVDNTGDVGTCADAPAPALTGPLAAANWAWWGPAAAPVAFGAAVLALWWRIRSTAASRARRRP
ncbi:hypothetical protein AB0A73_09160 [Glycomyces sp. NPDC047369]